MRSTTVGRGDLGKLQAAPKLQQELVKKTKTKAEKLAIARALREQFHDSSDVDGCWVGKDSTPRLPRSMPTHNHAPKKYKSRHYAPKPWGR